MFPNENITIRDNLTSNVLTNCTPIDYMRRADWIVPIAINILLLFLSAWALTSLIHYGIKTRKWSRRRRSNEEKLNAGLVYTSVILCAVFCLMRFIANLFFFNVGYGCNEDSVCDILSDLTSTLYTFVLFSSALFSWSRQRLFYSNRMLSVNYTKTIRFFSKFSIGIIVVCGLGVLIFNIVPSDHPSTPEGCTYKVANKILRIAYWISIVLALVFGQVTVLYLFAHALLIVRKSRPVKRSSAGENGSKAAASHNADHLSVEKSIPDNGNKNTLDSSLESGKSPRHKNASRDQIVSKTSDPIKSILRMTFIFATTSLLVDILIQVFSFFVLSGNRRVLTTLLNISSFLNLLLIIFAFKQYRAMLFSFFYKQ